MVARKFSILLPQRQQPNVRLELQHLEHARVIPQSFTMWGFLLPAFWLLYHRMFWVALCFAIPWLASALAYQQHWMSLETTLILRIGMHLVVGLMGNEWRVQHRLAKGDVLASEVYASDRLLALRTAIEKSFRGENGLQKEDAPS